MVNKYKISCGLHTTQVNTKYAAGTPFDGKSAQDQVEKLLGEMWRGKAGPTGLIENGVPEP